MTTTKRMIAAIAFCVATMSAAFAAGGDNQYRTYTLKGAYADVLQELRDAVINRGLVIDYTGDVNGMLSRTAQAVGSDNPYKNANYLHFCSAKLTHAAVAADPLNIALCPYVLFAFETKAQAGQIHVGYRRPPASATEASGKALAAVEKLLDEIAR